MVQMSKARMENRALPKRFYTTAEAVEQGSGYAIALDGRILRTSAKNPLYVAQHKLAVAVAKEWNDQAEYIQPDAMPLTRLFNIAIDRIPIDRPDILFDLLRYAETDLLCYRASHATLAAQQAQHFDFVLAWAARAHGIEMDITEGMMPIAQPPESLRRMAELFELANDHQLAGLALMVPLVGSALLALAHWQGAITLPQLLAATRVDEDFQIAQWGEDDEAKEAWQHKRRDIEAAAFFLDMQASEKSA